MKMFESEIRELQALVVAQNRSPGEQMRALLHAGIRAHRKAPNWIPEELDEGRS